MFLLYNLALALAVTVGVPLWVYKLLRHPKYRVGLSVRLGRVPARILRSHEGPAGRPVIWIHAVSVGEVLAISQLIQELRTRLSGHRLVVSTTTVTGQNLARDRFGAENVFFFPLDFGFSIRPYLRALNPKLVVMAETEFWPNFLRLAHASGAQIAVVNARISDRSLPGYTRWQRFLAGALAQVDLFLAQSDEDRCRLLTIGAPPDRVRVSGNLKFDVLPPAQLPLVDQLRSALVRGGGGPVIVAGSTTSGEESALIASFKDLLRQFPKAVLLLAPRHPERFDEVWNALPAQGAIENEVVAHAIPELAKFRRIRRSQCDLSVLALACGVLLLDTIGELASVYELADIAIVGGSFAPMGGHNILEPAHFAKPIVVGPHTENFRDIIAIFARAQALRIATAAKESDHDGDLATVLLELMQQPDARHQLGANAKAILESQRGASARTADALAELLGGRA